MCCIKRLPALLALLCGVGFAGAQDVVPGRILLKFKPGVTDARKAQIFKSESASRMSDIFGLDIQIVKIPEHASPRAFAASMKRFGEVEFAEPDYLEAPTEILPNDPFFTYRQMNLQFVEAPAAWSYSVGSSAVTIAILDSGVLSTHPDLAPNLVQGFNAYDNNWDTSDVYGHGTKVAGVAAAVGNNGFGVAGVSWNCKLMPVRVTRTDGYATSSAIASGLRWAADNGARVANLSFRITSWTSTYQTAFQYFRSKGGLVTASAGNSASNRGSADNPNVIVVSGTDDYDLSWSSSDFGNDVDVSAPMFGYSTTRTGNYTSVAGTSFSAPLTAGAIALIMSANPALAIGQVEEVLKSTSDDKGNSGWDMYYGWGRINVGRAVMTAMGSVPVDSESPSVSITSPSSNSQVSALVQITASAVDNNAVDRVRFYVDGVEIGQAIAPPYTVNWDTRLAAEGWRSIRAVAFDQAGNSSAATVQVNVMNTLDTGPEPGADTTAPSIQITSPVDGSTSGKGLKITVQASDNVGVTRVEFYLDGNLTANSTSAPFSVQLNPKKLSTGWHTLQCKAFDAAGNVAWSQIVNFRK